MATENSTYTINGIDTIRTSYCVYMDILGFTDDMLAASREERTEQELFQKLMKALSGQWSLSHNQPVSNLWTVKVFTDNVVLGYPLFTPDGEGEFGNLIIQIGNYQLSMALEGFFIRGGFSLGHLHVGEKIVYGKALLDAYKIENEVANNPRVVLSSEVCELVKQHLKYYGETKHAPHNSHVLVDADKQLFVNYLSSAVFENEVAWDVLMTHKQNIEYNLSKFYSSPKVWSKYLWVANYHNYFCQLIQGYSGYTSDVMIDKSLAVQTPSRLSDK